MLQSPRLVALLFGVLDIDLGAKDIEVLEFRQGAISTRLLFEYYEGLPAQLLRLSHAHLHDFTVGWEEHIQVDSHF